VALSYAILAHKHPAQVARLLRAIWHPDNFYVLHYERRKPKSEHEAIRRLAGSFSNVRVMPSRAIQWGRYSQLAAQLEASAICQRWSSEWTHFINLTGQDFPLVSQGVIMEELSLSEDASFVSYFDPYVTGQWCDLDERVERVHLDSALLEAVLRVPGLGRQTRALLGWTNRLPFIPCIRRPRPQSFRYFGGANHFILSRRACALLQDDIRAREIIHWLRLTGFPEECSVQTALLNSKLANNIVNDDRRAIFWKRQGDPSPQTLTHLDWPRLENARTEGKLFARKFDQNVDEEVIGILEKSLLS
jgi:hypothetical protein